LLEVEIVSFIPFIYYFLSYRNTALLRAGVSMSFMGKLFIHILPPENSSQLREILFWGENKFEDFLLSPVADRLHELHDRTALR
jgi:hypothetical protein